MSNPVLSCQNLSKSYPHSGGKVQVLKNASLTVEEKELVALVGASGCGKSTLLHILGLLDVADSGELLLFGSDSSNLTDAERTQMRRTSIGFVYQSHHLLPEFTALENVCMPLWLNGVRGKQANEKAAEMLARVDLEHRENHFPSELSGGEMQRVAIARALVLSPKLLLADEPTGNLDPHNAKMVLSCLKKACREEGVSGIIVTHSMEIAQSLDRVLSIQEGHIVRASAT